MKLPTLPALAVLLFSCLSLPDLVKAWNGSPSERYAWIILIIWMVPIIVCWNPSKNIFLLLLALVFDTMGIIGEIRAFQYIGLALALASLIYPSWKMTPWVLVSLFWMPLMGWYAAHNFYDYNFVLRSLTVALGSIWMIVLNLKNKRLYEKESTENFMD